MENPGKTLQSAIRNACRQCGGASTRLTPKGRLSKICSDECETERVAAQTWQSDVRAGRLRAEPFPARPCAGCGSPFTPRDARQVTCSAECRPLHRRGRTGYVGPLERDCAHCGTPFTTKQPSQVYCSKACGVPAYRLANPDRVAETREKTAAKHAARYAAEQRERAAAERAARPVKPCTLCARPFQGLAATCSDPCARERSRLRLLEAYYTRVAAVTETFTAECAECAQPFTYESMSGPRRGRTFCSKACRVLPARRLRRARLRRKAPGVDHESDRVVGYGWIRKRDGWTCQVCDVPTPRALLGTHVDDAPELDHVIPLALGGFHQPGNLWLLCRACNGAKNARDPLEFVISRLCGDPARLSEVIARIGRVFSFLEA